jgi:hypothetical protein
MLRCFGDFLGLGQADGSELLLYVTWFSIGTDQGGHSHGFVAVAMHVCVIEDMIRVTISFLMF